MSAEHTPEMVIVGAGAAGLYALYQAHQRGMRAIVLERGASVGGTWYWNRYPGARCDVESFDYSFSFSEELQQEWVWSERYAPQAEILAYLEHVADRFDLRGDTRLGSTVTGAYWDDSCAQWTVVTEEGPEYRCRWLIMATGVLSTPKIPDIAGLDDFRGEVYNTANWPEEGVDFTGKKVAVIGTGSSGVQIIPVAAETAVHLFVLQRTPSFTIPARNRAWTNEEDRAVKANYPRFRYRARHSVLGAYVETTGKKAFEVNAAEREAAYRTVWEYGSTMRYANVFDDIVIDQTANDTAADFIRARIREIITDPVIAEKMIPRGYALATRRLCAGTDFYETFNRDNVTLVDLREEALVGFAPHGIVTARHTIGVDLVILATGFDAVTGTLTRLDIEGVDGETIAHKWGQAPSAYLGLTVAGFPNFFVPTGPGSPSVLSNMFVSIEQHIEFIFSVLDYAREHGFDRIEATEEAEQAWVTHAAEVADATLFRDASSWYVGANVPGKPRVLLQYVAGVGPYQDILDRVARDGFRGFSFASSITSDISDLFLNQLSEGMSL